MSVCGTDNVYICLAAFPGSLASVTCRTLRLLSSSLLSVNVYPDLPKYTTYQLKPPLPTGGSPSLLRHYFTLYVSTGILTCFPSNSPFGYSLGPDSPCADLRSAGNLRLSAYGFFTRIIVTHVSIRSSDISSRLLNPPSSTYRTLPYRPSSISTLRPVASVDSFSPDSSSAQADSTSELLRFL